AELVAPLVAAADGLELIAGRVRRRAAGPQMQPALERLLGPLLERLAGAPFEAPVAADLAAAGLGPRDLAAAAAAGAILRLPGDVVLLPDAPVRAAAVLGRMERPFTLSEARSALGTSRRVAVPLLEHMDRSGMTCRLDDTRRVVTPR
ncbi:MAG: SelB domain-containing protein, partial [Acidimicrobiales bacterium]